MKAKFGAIVVAGSGKIGGHVMSRNRGGAYMRTKGIATNPNTSAQQVARSILSSLSSAWSSLTESQRLGWNNAVADFAKTDVFGDIKNPSGINLFIKLNSNLSNIGEAVLLDAPAKLEVPFSLITNAVFDVSDVDLSVTFGDGSYSATPLLVYATPTLSDGVTFVKNKMRVIGFIPDDSAIIAIGAMYVAKFGTPAVGANISFGFQPVVASGQKGVIQTVKASVVA